MSSQGTVVANINIKTAVIFFAVLTNWCRMPPGGYQNNIRLIGIYIDLISALIASQSATRDCVMPRELRNASRNKTIRGIALNANAIDALHSVKIFVADIR